MPQKNEHGALIAVDLFAGGGGLTVGLKRAGFHVAAGVECEAHAFATYKANHADVHGFKQDIRTISGECLLGTSPTKHVDLIAGCPPCQGFSSLTSKYRRHDPRNDLIREMGRLIGEVRPRAVMMENVPGLAQKGKPLLDEFIEALDDLGYQVNFDVLQVADYGVPQSRRRLVLLAGQGFTIDLPRPTHDREGKDGLLPWVPVRSVIEGLPEPMTLEEARRNGGPVSLMWHVVRTLAPQNQRRIKKALPGKGWTRIPKRLRPTCHQDRGAGFSNVYGRMDWGQVSPTITGGCTTFSKGRFGHPEDDRTISVYEAALLQTFPEDYVIDTPYMEYACNIVGNALPCGFAEAVAKQCVAALASTASRNVKKRRRSPRR